MSGGGSGVSTATPYSFDSSKLGDFVKTGVGQKYAGSYNPDAAYAQIGDSIQVYNPSDIKGPLNMYSKVGNDVSGMLQDYKVWLQGNQQTQANWDAYSKSVAANSGGQGDNTVTVGNSVSQRQQLLGALANAGNPTNPSPGLGSMGKIK